MSDEAHSDIVSPKLPLHYQQMKCGHRRRRNVLRSSYHGAGRMGGMIVSNNTAGELRNESRIVSKYPAARRLFELKNSISCTMNARHAHFQYVSITPPQRRIVVDIAPRAVLFSNQPSPMTGAAQRRSGTWQRETGNGNARHRFQRPGQANCRRRWPRLSQARALSRRHATVSEDAHDAEYDYLRSAITAPISLNVSATSRAISAVISMAILAALIWR